MGKDVIIACDFSSGEETLRFLDRFTGRKPFVKIGMELFYAEGPAIVRALKARGHRIFLDLKLHDIPNTVKKAMAVLSGLDVDICNLHAGGTVKMMEAALEGLKRPDGTRPLLIAVTQLTSTDQAAMEGDLWIREPIDEVVLHYAENAKKAGLDGVVCSPLEAGKVHARCGRDFLTVTPGVRFADGDRGDQKRVMTPEEAKRTGSDYIVVGRPITAAEDPVAAYERCVLEFVDEPADVPEQPCAQAGCGGAGTERKTDKEPDPMNMEKKIAEDLLSIGAVFFRPDEPFTWASGIKSPVYCDNRLTLTDPAVRTDVEEGLAALVKGRFPEAEVLMGTSTAGIAHAAITGHILGLPMGYVRSGAKDHGRQNRIEGKLLPGQKTVVVEDLISTGGSVIEVVEALREAGADVLGIVSIFTYGMKKGLERLAAAEVENVSLTNFDAVAETAAEQGYIRPEDVARLIAFRNNPSDESWIRKD
ncbi:MAG: orotidine-5'-phosphate decarboxylase [Lachnospiraceae bacterium]|nr:orotidine-5'-phosphate decarboxylase [Lachnospiraceae bacterium]